MPTRSHVVRLGDDQLGRHRHVCGLFDGPDDAARVLLPFVLDGIQRGDRVIHVVQDRAAHVARLPVTADVSAALASGHLEIRTWDEAYLSWGGFSSAKMLAYIRHLLREGPSLGFPATRLIGDMEWALSGAPGVEELIDYERGLNAMLARPRAWAVCAYDLRRHAGRAEDLVPFHQAAVVTGRLQQTAQLGRAATPRDRVLASASLLFAENGIARTGVDTLIEAAGVAKATFYRHFPSKDALVVAWLEEPRTRWFDRVRLKAESEAARPGDVVPRLFEAVAEWLEAGDFVGCPYLNTAVEVSGSAHPAGEASRGYLAEIREYLTRSLAGAGHANAARLGPQLHALLAGAISLGVATRSTTPVLAARDASVRLIEGDAGP